MASIHMRSLPKQYIPYVYGYSFEEFLSFCLFSVTLSHYQKIKLWDALQTTTYDRLLSYEARRQRENVPDMERSDVEMERAAMLWRILQKMPPRFPDSVDYYAHEDEQEQRPMRFYVQQGIKRERQN